MSLIFHTYAGEAFGEDRDWLVCWRISHRCRQSSVLCYHACVQPQVVAVLGNVTRMFSSVPGPPRPSPLQR
jgi:hypothetical protein